MELNEKMIQVNHLSKSFGNVKAVDDISFQVKLQISLRRQIMFGTCNNDV